MAISFLQNIPADTVRRHLSKITDEVGRTYERIASGKRINHSSDDAAGLTIAESLEGRIRSMGQAKRNALDAMSMVQVAEGGMNEVGNILIRMRELAIQSASDSVGSRERHYLSLETEQLKSELTRLANATRFFDTDLLNGKGRNFTFQIGPDDNEHNRISYDASKINLTAEALNVDSVDLTEQDEARDSLQYIDQALYKLGEPRAELGAIQSRVQSITQQLSIGEETLTAAKSRIMDADLAEETTELVRQQILQRAAVAALSQANSMPQQALRLLEF